MKKWSWQECTKLKKLRLSMKNHVLGAVNCLAFVKCVNRISRSHVSLYFFFLIRHYPNFTGESEYNKIKKVRIHTQFLWNWHGRLMKRANLLLKLTIQFGRKWLCYNILSSWNLRTTWSHSQCENDGNRICGQFYFCQHYFETLAKFLIEKRDFKQLQVQVILFCSEVNGTYYPEFE